jgi:hypothetical protein
MLSSAKTIQKGFVSMPKITNYPVFQDTIIPGFRVRRNALAE